MANALLCKGPHNCQCRHHHRHHHSTSLLTPAAVTAVPLARAITHTLRDGCSQPVPMLWLSCPQPQHEQGHTTAYHAQSPPGRYWQTEEGGGEMMPSGGKPDTHTHTQASWGLGSQCISAALLMAQHGSSDVLCRTLQHGWNCAERYSSMHGRRTPLRPTSCRRFCAQPAAAFYSSNTNKVRRSSPNFASARSCHNQLSLSQKVGWILAAPGLLHQLQSNTDKDVPQTHSRYLTRAEHQRDVHMHTSNKHMLPMAKVTHIPNSERLSKQKHAPK